MLFPPRKQCGWVRVTSIGALHRLLRRFRPLYAVASPGVLRSNPRGNYRFLLAQGLRPPLLKRFPNATDDQLREAHAYAYGGAIIQDMGYYPFGSKFFSDLVH